jgi:hypothetical protein
VIGLASAERVDAPVTTGVHAVSAHALAIIGSHDAAALMLFIEYPP